MRESRPSPDPSSIVDVPSSLLHMADPSFIPTTFNLCGNVFLGYNGLISITSMFLENLALRLCNLIEGKKKYSGTFLMEAMSFTQPLGKIHVITITFDY